MAGAPADAVLVLPPGLTASASRVAAAARRRGLDVVRLPSPVVPADLAARAGAAHLHAGPTFVDAVAGALDVAPLEAPVDWLARLPRALVRRRIEAVSLREAHGLRSPAFVKSPNDKSVPARVYPDGTRLPGSDAVDPSAPVLVSDVVTYRSEVRLFVLDGEVRTASRYAEDRDLAPGPAPADALAFGADVLVAAGASLPSAIVVDVGRDADGAWSVVEANAAWASGSYAADPDAVLDVVLRAAGPRAAVADRDRPFVRGGWGSVDEEP
ncbi:ATP-grasp domain-containing protein [Nocardioides litoris]|uniref:ATP-grasp domain-containing protein n=1 Tax=Nocardioides litoris TaxID=1926648 RepID=UPI001B866C63|nr:ATP-grasp domain-containing protein [Nocardioides litoris]